MTDDPNGLGNCAMKQDLSIDRVMQTVLLSCRRDTLLCDAAARMAERRCSAMLVMDQGQVLGIWTERDSLDIDFGDAHAMRVPIGEVLSYREATRRRAIDMLAELASDNAQAGRAWRESLVWLDASPADAPRYTTYQKAHPDDDDLLALYEEKVAVTPVSQSATHRAQGYEELEEGRLAQATQAFEAALAVDDQDADAQAGLGLIALRRDDYSAAVSGLERAMQLDPEKRGQWLEAYSTATFLDRLAQARHSVRNGNLEQALDRVQPLTQGSGANARAARLLEADVLKRQGRLEAAEQRYRAVLNSHSSSTPARLGLIDVLERQQRWEEAEQMVTSLPASARQGGGNIRGTQAQVLRRQAASQLPAEAESTLRRALELDPTAPWVRLDLARLVDQRGQPRQAREIVAPSSEERASPEQRYAAALLASEQQRWTDSQDWLALRQHGSARTCVPWPRRSRPRHSWQTPGSSWQGGTDRGHRRPCRTFSCRRPNHLP